MAEFIMCKECNEIMTYADLVPEDEEQDEEDGIESEANYCPTCGQDNFEEVD